MIPAALFFFALAALFCAIWVRDLDKRLRDIENKLDDTPDRD